MPRMHLLRTSSMLARLILAWFVLTMGAAIASPLVHPQAMELVCTTGSTAKLVDVGDVGDVGPAGTPSAHHALDCPLCLHLGAPPRQVQPLAAVHPQPLAHALRPIMAPALAALAGAPLPPRGPPAFIA